MKKLLLLLMIALVPIIANAQDSNLRFTTSIGASSTSYKPPITSLGLSSSVDIGKSVLELRARYSFARKDPGDGHNVGGSAALRIPAGRFFAGPAFAYSRQTTSIWRKTAAGPGAQIGTRKRNVILSLTFTQDVVSVNKGRTYSGELEWYGKPRGGVAPYIAVNGALQDFRCHETGHGPVDHCLGTGGSVSFGLIFWRGKHAE